jgi:hypothetical protein
MARDPLKSKLIRVLEREFPGKKERIVLRDGFQGSIHLYVISDKFRNKRLRAKGEMIWPILFRELTEDEWGRITLTTGIAPDEIDGRYPELSKSL